MTNEEKELLLKDLCARLPYGVKVYGNYSYSNGEKIIDDTRVETLDLSKLDWFVNGIEIKPYLRQMSSMTEEEEIAYLNLEGAARIIDWLNTHHFDYRGLIKKGLALEAPEGMYMKGGEE